MGSDGLHQLLYQLLSIASNDLWDAIAHHGAPTSIASNVLWVLIGGHMHARHGAYDRSPRRPHRSPHRYEAGELARSIAHAYKDVVLRPYRGAQTQGALGFGKGLLSFGFGFLAMPVRRRWPLMACAHPLIWQVRIEPNLAGGALAWGLLFRTGHGRLARGAPS